MRNIADELRKNYERISSEEARNLYAKIHALDIHQYRNTPLDQRPRISENTPETSLRIAHDYIHTALKYLVELEGFDSQDENLRQEVSDGLLRAAQHLEKLYLNRSHDTPQRTEELYNAALAYYLAGHAPRAFVIMRGIRHGNETLSDHQLMRSMFLRELTHIRRASLTRLSQRDFEDELLAGAVRAGNVLENEAIEEALRHTLNKVYLLFFEFARTGQETQIERALDLAYLGYRIAIDQQLRHWWWLFQCTKALLIEYRESSLWSCLRPMLVSDTTGSVERYIKSAFSRTPAPVLELWSSQQHALKYLNDGQSYCLKMPTSSGKTRIAELAILQFLMDTEDQPEKKCLYIAPYRALAVEIEDTFKRSFSSIGVQVSQLYGSYDLNPAEYGLAEKTKILIGTPEKLDAFLRYTPLVSEQVGLVIVDEGHIIDSGDRGLRYELFIHRLVRRYERQGVRMIFISAVMPNVDQFSTWITGRDAASGVIDSNWRASQQMLGVISWNGRNGRVDYLYRDLERLSQDFFISNYFTPLPPADLRAARCGVARFPRKNATKADLIALAAIKAVSEGATLVFAPKISLVKKTAESVLRVVEILDQVNQHFGRLQQVLPVTIKSDEHKAKLRECIRYAQETTGHSSIIVRALERGVVVHHSGVPRGLRVCLEELVREGILHLVIATNTLAQGVNLPFKTILIHSLSQSKEHKVKPRDFWNICGRAGRATVETEGSVFLLVDATKPTKPDNPTPFKQAEAQLELYVRQTTSEQIVSIYP